MVQVSTKMDGLRRNRHVAGLPARRRSSVRQYEFDQSQAPRLQVWNYNVQFEPVLGFGIKDNNRVRGTAAIGPFWMTWSSPRRPPGMTIANTVVDLQVCRTVHPADRQQRMGHPGPVRTQRGRFHVHSRAGARAAAGQRRCQCRRGQHTGLEGRSRRHLARGVSGHRGRGTDAGRHRRR